MQRRRFIFSFRVHVGFVRQQYFDEVFEPARRGEMKRRLHLPICRINSNSLCQKKFNQRLVADANRVMQSRPFVMYDRGFGLFRGGGILLDGIFNEQSSCHGFVKSKDSLLF